MSLLQDTLKLLNFKETNPPPHLSNSVQLVSYEDPELLATALEKLAAEVRSGNQIIQMIHVFEAYAHRPPYVTMSIDFRPKAIT